MINARITLKQRSTIFVEETEVESGQRLSGERIWKKGQHGFGLAVPFSFLQNVSDKTATLSVGVSGSHVLGMVGQ